MKTELYEDGNDSGYDNDSGNDDANDNATPIMWKEYKALLLLYSYILMPLKR